MKKNKIELNKQRRWRWNKHIIKTTGNNHYVIDKFQVTGNSNEVVSSNFNI
jgi:hypothetical protein